jgi:hypothetical protein
MDPDATKSYCKMCGAQAPLVKSHIIPESLHPHKTTSLSQVTKLYFRSPDLFPKKSPIGIWDKTILCDQCEKLFSACDDYAQNVLRNRPVAHASGHLGLEFNYPLLKRFFLGLLWRATVSTHVMYSLVNVGAKHEARLRELILSNEPGDEEEYAVWLSTFDDDDTKGIILQPSRYKFFGVNVYRFFVAGFVIFIKVDQRLMPRSWKQIILKPNQPAKVAVRNWKTSMERREMLQVVATAKGP